MHDLLSADAIASRLATRVVGRNLEFYRSIGSTNSRAVALARQGAPDGTLVVADEQTAGRGRLGRQWLSPPGSSLLMSLLFRPPLLPRQAQRLAMVCSLAVVDASAHVGGLEARIKWPNDMLVAGLKLGGLLTELGATGPRLDYVVVGMGLNVNLEPQALGDVASLPTSFQAQIGRAVSRLDLLVEILLCVERRYDRLREGWSPHEEWRDHLETLGRQVNVGLPDGSIDGLAVDVDADGALLVRTVEGRLERVLAGDVTLRGHASVSEAE